MPFYDARLTAALYYAREKAVNDGGRRDAALECGAGRRLPARQNENGSAATWTLSFSRTVSTMSLPSGTM